MEHWPFGLLQRHAYGVIYADPPWGFETWSSKTHGLRVPQHGTAHPDKDHYPVMSTPDMARLPVGDLARNNCALLMWTISSHTPQAFWLAYQWGFRFASKAFTWAKLNKNAEDNLLKRHKGLLSAGKISDNENWFMGMGHGTRRNTEDCWLFTKGQPVRTLIRKDSGKIEPDYGVRELIVAPVREHSRKPDEAYSRIERLFAGPHCELFARTNRPGWDSWGNETEKFT